MRSTLHGSSGEWVVAARQRADVARPRAASKAFDVRGRFHKAFQNGWQPSSVAAALLTGRKVYVERRSAAISHRHGLECRFPGHEETPGFLCSQRRDPEPDQNPARSKVASFDLDIRPSQFVLQSWYPCATQ